MTRAEAAAGGSATKSTYPLDDPAEDELAAWPEAEQADNGTGPVRALAGGVLAGAALYALAFVTWAAWKGWL